MLVKEKEEEEIAEEVRYADILGGIKSQKQVLKHKDMVARLEGIDVRSLAGRDGLFIRVQ